MSHWRGAPAWAIDLLEMQYQTVLQNEAILAKLDARLPRLSAKDQRDLDEIVNTLKGTNEKIESAKKDSLPNPD